MMSEKTTISNTDSLYKPVLIKIRTNNYTANIGNVNFTGSLKGRNYKTDTSAIFTYLKSTADYWRDFVAEFEWNFNRSFIRGIIV